MALEGSAVGVTGWFGERWEADLDLIQFRLKKMSQIGKFGFELSQSLVK